jgi:hypothetical protein
VTKLHAVYDVELLGRIKPVFLVNVVIRESGERFSFWHDKRGHTAKLYKMLQREDLTWVSFNGENFDRPLIAAACMGHDEDDLKTIAQAIIDDGMRSWQTYKHFKLDFMDYDHIDLIETAPGVMISLKTYAGRMHYPTMQDMPFHHDDEIDTPKKRKIVEDYCFNDIGVTMRLFDKLKTELELRVEMGAEYGIDLRSKSDAQAAEAILKKQVGIFPGDKLVPRSVTYTAPKFIKTRSKVIKDLIYALEEDEFVINRGNGSPIEAEWMAEPIKIGKGIYKVGLGGLHSQHDKNFHVEATDDLLISDFDVASYYPNIMMKAGLVPRLGGNKGQLFLDEYENIYDRRMEAKRSGNKKVANTLKIVLNGTFGKLGSIYSAFYSPDLLIAVTITGQLNLLCVIDELEKIKGVTVTSANTDGVMVTYSPANRDAVLKVFETNAKRTGFEYEETPYRRVAMKDVNNYIAIGTDGKVKTKGLYAESGLMKNPTMQVCSDAVVAYLKDGTMPEEYVYNCEYIEDFVSIRNVKGGGVQHTKLEVVDDWFLAHDIGTKDNEWRSARLNKIVKRKSRPHPVEVGVGGVPFGRVARWYMTTQELQPISYVGSGSKVPKTEGAKVCMTLPDGIPADLDHQWYVNETYSILTDLGCGL